MRTVKYLLCPLMAAFLLAGCAGDESSNTDSRPAEGAPAGAAAPRQEIVPGDRDASGLRSGPTQRIKFSPGSERTVAYTATLEIQAKNVDRAATRAKEMVTAAGGHVQTETADSEPVSANITFQIPADRYATVLDQLAKQLGTRLSLRQRAEDVTEEVADVDSRVRSAEATLKSLRKLLDRADTVGEVLNVEQQISQRQADLEALQARQKSLAQRTQFATVTLRLEAPHTSAARSSGGFVGGLKSGWEAFITVLSGLAVGLGWLLPFLVFFVLIAVPAWRLRRFTARLVPRRPTPPRPAPAQPAPAQPSPAQPVPAQPDSE